jgi:hypothetical protein
MSMAKKTAAAPPTALKDPVVEDPVAAARAEVVRLNDQELRLAMSYRAKSAELADVRLARGDQVRGAADPAGAAQESARRVIAIREELEALADGSRSARERRLAAIPAVFEAEASAKERQAELLEVEGAKLEAESKRLREALERHDDWGYVAAPAKIDGRYFQTIPDGGGAFRQVDVRGPGFMRRLSAARASRQEAAEHRLKKPHQAGSVEADTVEDLLAAVHTDATRVGPPIDAIIAWSEKAIEDERRRRAHTASTEYGFVPVDAPMRLLLEWRAGVIDQTQSHVMQPEPSEVTAWPVDRAPAAAAPAEKVRRRPESSRLPHDTSATPAEIAREAAATGESIEEVAKKFGVPVPKELAQAMDRMASPYEVAQVEAK